MTKAEKIIAVIIAVAVIITTTSTVNLINIVSKYKLIKENSKTTKQECK